MITFKKRGLHGMLVEKDFGEAVT